jgi:sugar lactone lactonase YvrE
MSASAQVSLSPLFEGGTYLECPRWHDGRWWASDFYRRTVYAYDANGTETAVLEVENQPSGLGWLPGGDLLVVSMTDRRVLRRAAADGSVTEHADVSTLTVGHLNDMVVDAAGRAYAGCFGFDLMSGAAPAPAVIVRIDPDGRAEVAADDLWFPNGAVVSEDGGTLIVAETFAARFSAFTVCADGTLTDRRVWAQLGSLPEPAQDPLEMLGATTFAPDGCALDAEGHVWVANSLGGPVLRIAPDGSISGEAPLPGGLTAFACGLGGDDERELIVCAAPDFFEEARSAAREGVLLRGRVDVPHSGRP